MPDNKPKTCTCGRFIRDDVRGCWMYPSGQEIRTKRDFHCYNCGAKLRSNGQTTRMIEER